MDTMVDGALYLRTSSEAETKNPGPLESDHVSPHQEDMGRKGLSEGELQKLGRAGEKSVWVKTESGGKLSLVLPGEVKPLLIAQGDGSQSFMCLRISWRDCSALRRWGLTWLGVCNGTLEPAF